MDNF
jgi:vacuolar protein sorting-associated protein 13A/C